MLDEMGEAALGVGLHEGTGDNEQADADAVAGLGVGQDRVPQAVVEAAPGDSRVDRDVAGEVGPVGRGSAQRGGEGGGREQQQAEREERQGTVLHAGGKFGAGGYKVSGGLHGVGVSVVNALSTEFVAEIKRDGKIYRQEFSKGIACGGIQVVGESDCTGTMIHFMPDAEIFEEVLYKYETLEYRLRELAFLNRGISITLEDKREGQEKSKLFYYTGGIIEFVKYLNKSKDPIHDEIIYFEKKVDTYTVEVAMQYTDVYIENIYSFANNINTIEGGMHLTGFKSALTRAINEYAKKAKFIKDKDDTLTGEDVREGLTAIISVKLEDPQYEGQTKTKLGNPPVRQIVDSVTFETFEAFLEENPQTARIIIDKSLRSQRAREAAKKARELTRRKSVLESTSLPGKHADCSEKDPSKSVIYIVLGDSAGGSAKEGRDRKTQAILPLRGKILNVEKSRLDRILSSDENRIWMRNRR